jgi:hypothetical protein
VFDDARHLHPCLDAERVFPIPGSPTHREHAETTPREPGQRLLQRPELRGTPDELCHGRDPVARL